MCKSDILKAFGYHVNVTSRRRAQFSAPSDDQHVVHVTADSDHMSDANSTASESNAFPFPVVSEIHDPFSFTPSASPQLVQVMHTTNARGFSIIPLTVHNPNSAPIILNGGIERHHPITLPAISSNNTGKGDNSNASGNSAPGARLLRSAAHSSGQRKNRGHIVNLVHVRSRSLSHATLPALSNQTQVQIEHHEQERPSAVFRSSPTDEIDPQRVPSPAPDATSSPVDMKMQNFVHDFSNDDESASTSNKLSRPSTIASSTTNTKRVPSPARLQSAAPYSAFHVARGNSRHTSNSVPYDSISVESL
jgi:hypothetical protein